MKEQNRAEQRRGEEEKGTGEQGRSRRRGRGRPLEHQKRVDLRITRSYDVK